jgi:hypothetical protein
MSDTIPVVRESYARDTAEQRGYNKFADMDETQVVNADPTMITDSAWWANHELPRLRAMAGADDHGHGTYTDHQDIALIPVGDEDDRPAEAELLRAQQFSRHVFQAYRDQAYQCYCQQRKEAGIDES